MFNIKYTFVSGHMQRKLRLVYVGNLRLFEKEARAKYIKKAGSPDEQTLEAARIDQRYDYNFVIY